MTLHRDRNKTGENEAGVPAKVSLFASYVLGGVLLLVPFHALLTVFASTIVGNYDLLRLWKEILMLALVPFAVFVVWKTPDLQRRLREGWLFWAMASYAALHICLGLIALAKGQVNTYALLYAWVVNLRPLLIFTLAFVFAWPVGLARPLGRDLTMGRSAGQLAWLYRYWKQILLVPAALVIGFGMLQATVLPYDFLRGFGYSMATIEPYQTVDDKLGYIRIQSTLRGANPLGAYLVVVLSALVVLIGLLSKRFLSKHDSDVTSQHSRGDKALSANKLPKELPILARAWAASKTGHTIAIVLLTLAGAGVLAATYSRSAYIGMAVAALAILLLAVHNRRARHRLWWGLAVFGVLLAGAFVLFRDNDRFENTFFHTNEHSQSAESSNAQHLSALGDGLYEVAHEPFGRGPGTAGPASAHNVRPARIAESYYLQIGQEVGWLGLGLFVTILVLVACRLWYLRTDPLARALLVSLIGICTVNAVQHAWTDDTLALVWWGLAGVALSAVSLRGRRT